MKKLNIAHTPSTQEAVVQVENLWKFFGAREMEALRAVRDQKLCLSKTEIQEKFDCVLGVSDVSFDVKKGEIFCIMGLSGSGKSTLLRHLNQLVRPTTGTVRIRGKDVGKMGDAELRNLRATQTGMVFQHMALMPHWTVRENVTFPLEIQKFPREQTWQVAEKVLSLVGLSHCADYSPDQLSGGMKQRVGLARALAADPPILLMDEPFSALDPLIRRELQSLFMELSRELGKTAVFITHDLDEAIRIGDRIAIMKDGRIVQSGVPREIVFNPEDDYVRDFVKDLSRVKFLTIADLMRPLRESPVNINALQRLSPDTSAEIAIRSAIGNDGIFLVAAEDEEPRGIITKDDLLAAIV